MYIRPGWKVICVEDPRAAASDSGVGRDDPVGLMTTSVESNEYESQAQHAIDVSLARRRFDFAAKTGAGPPAARHPRGWPHFHGRRPRCDSGGGAINAMSRGNRYRVRPKR
jgi:hypothetical protein